jgi:hypothetical protein
VVVLVELELRALMAQLVQVLQAVAVAVWVQQEQQLLLT